MDSDAEIVSALEMLSVDIALGKGITLDEAAREIKSMAEQMSPVQFLDFVEVWAK